MADIERAITDEHRGLKPGNVSVIVEESTRTKGDSVP
jgi:hypothetical protein